MNKDLYIDLLVDRVQEQEDIISELKDDRNYWRSQYNELGTHQEKIAVITQLEVRLYEEYQKTYTLMDKYLWLSVYRITEYLNTNDINKLYERFCLEVEQ